MTSTFSDFVATKPEKDLMQSQVQDYCKLLCQALIENYKSYTIRSHNHSIVRALDRGDSSSVQYHEDRIQEVVEDICCQMRVCGPKGRKWLSLWGLR